MTKPRRHLDCGYICRQVVVEVFLSSKAASTQWSNGCTWAEMGPNRSAAVVAITAGRSDNRDHPRYMCTTGLRSTSMLVMMVTPEAATAEDEPGPKWLRPRNTNPAMFQPKISRFERQSLRRVKTDKVNVSPLTQKFSGPTPVPLISATKSCCHSLT